MWELKLANSKIAAPFDVLEPEQTNFLLDKKNLRIIEKKVWSDALTVSHDRDEARISRYRLPLERYAQALGPYSDLASSIFAACP